MSDHFNFNAAAVADHMRTEAKVELHDDKDRGPLLELYSLLQPNQIKAIAGELEKGNSSFSSAPHVDVTRENGEVTGMTFRPGNLDLNSNAQVLRLADNSKVAIETKESKDFAVVSGREKGMPTDHPVRYVEPQAYRFIHPNYPNSVHESLAHFTEGAVGATLGRSLIKPALTLASEQTAAIGTAKGSFLRGVTVGAGVETSELMAYNGLKDSHPNVAAFLKPSTAEAGIVGAAAALGGGNVRLRVGLVAGAWLVGKAYTATYDALENMKNGH